MDINFGPVKIKEHNNKLVTMSKLSYRTLSLFLLACVLVLTPTACVEKDDQGQQKDTNQDLGSVVSFSGTFENAKTRTSGKYGIIKPNDLGITFYWTPNDYQHLFINKGTDAEPVWEKSTGQHWNDKEATTHAESANFRFRGIYPNRHYTLLYVGGDQSSAAKDKLYVTFAPTQKQISLEDSEMANSGDCGVAVTECEYYNKKGVGYGYHGDRHKFVLEHKAAYITFMPYNPRGDIRNTRLISVQLIADQSVWGKFPFTAKGVDISKRPLNKTKVTLKLDQPGKSNGLPITSNKESARDSVGILIIPPGKYTNVRVKYIIKDHSTNNRHTVTKRYPVLDLPAGTNQPVFWRLNVEDFTPSFVNYSMWGAEELYYTLDMKAPRNWNKNASGIPAPENEIWPQGDDDQRWYSEESEAPAGVPTDIDFTPNDAAYFFTKECFWDKEFLWSFDGHLYQGVLWVPTIRTGHSIAYDGKNWKNEAVSVSKTKIDENEDIKHPYVGYYPLPLLGRYINGALVEVGKAGYYWINGADPNNPESKAYYIKVTKDGVSLHNDGDKKWGCIPFTGDIRP